MCTQRLLLNYFCSLFSKMCVFLKPSEMRKYNYKDVCISLCLLQILKTEDSLLGCNYFFFQGKNKHFPENSEQFFFSF